MMKGLLFKTTKENGLVAEIAMTGLRVFFGLAMAFGHGFKKVPPGEEFILGVTSLGFPMPEFFAWSAGLSEFIGGLFIAIGILTRPSAAFIAITMAVAAFGRHAADPFKAKELALLYLVIGIVFAIRGAGKYSLDRIASK